MSCGAQSRVSVRTVGREPFGEMQSMWNVVQVEVCGKKKTCFYASTCTLVNGYLYHCGQIYLPEEFCVSCGCCMRTINRRQRTCTRVVPTRMQEKYRR